MTNLCPFRIGTDFTCISYSLKGFDYSVHPPLWSRANIQSHPNGVRIRNQAPSFHTYRYFYTGYSNWWEKVSHTSPSLNNIGAKTLIEKESL